jgi:hypothetical protein
MRIITKRSRWGHREFIVINRWPGPRWSRHQQTCGTVSARVGHSKRIHLSELSSFRTIEGACSRLLPSHAPLGKRSSRGRPDGISDEKRPRFRRSTLPRSRHLGPRPFAFLSRAALFASESRVPIVPFGVPAAAAVCSDICHGRDSSFSQSASAPIRGCAVMAVNDGKGSVGLC